MRKVTLQKFIDEFEGKQVEFTEFEREYKERIQYVMQLIIDDFTLTDKHIYDLTRKQYKVTYPTVLQDILVSQRLLSNQISPNGNPQKVWIRYMVEQSSKKAMQMAEEKGDVKAYNQAIANIGKYHMADKEDVILPNYDDIVPFNPVLTLDPKVLGIELPADFEQKREKMRLKFKNDYEDYMRKLTIPEAEIVKEEDED